MGGSGEGVGAGTHVQSSLYAFEHDREFTVNALFLQDCSPVTPLPDVDVQSEHVCERLYTLPLDVIDVQNSPVNPAFPLALIQYQGEAPHNAAQFAARTTPLEPTTGAVDENGDRVGPGVAAVA